MQTLPEVNRKVTKLLRMYCCRVGFFAKILKVDREQADKEHLKCEAGFDFDIFHFIPTHLDLNYSYPNSGASD